MKAKRVVPREQASRDVDEAVAHYLSEAGQAVALRLIDALQRAYGHIARHPAKRSPRYAHELNLPGLRAWPLTRYPHLVFDVERADHIEVWRVLHGQRDIPAWMREPDGVGRSDRRNEAEGMTA
ncbi:MAG: type II toxin-antitoxin system RelE/ParE family toxin [Tepidimonas sp.]|uniref:type II toxin-antitoxin system RelE/ParE family toxin n=1 Tax=Tepidimonas sp. TaxID=2002775 RepID=UPI00298F263B|nr:type II toxin-antitoxin system RelE/ParE family toxin [Tepidimonas sp.]MDW8337387.1 type II toxin-antitoxin system RelE/ParE family toxin [Tepidimonas sp.]